MNKSPWRHFIRGTITLVLPLSGVAWWIYVASTNPGTFEDMQAQFMTPFPAFLGARAITLIELAMCGLAALMFFKGLDEKGVVKMLNLIMLGLSGLLGAWLLFSLM